MNDLGIDTIAERLSPYLVAAAVLPTFAPENLHPVGGAKIDLADIGAMLTHFAEKVRIGPYRDRWRLREDVRRSVIASIGTPDRLEAALGANPEPFNDPTQHAIAEVIKNRGEIKLTQRSLPELLGLERAIDWLSPLFSNLPEQGEVRARIERYKLLEPMQRLADDFEGRTIERGHLRGFVDSLRSQSWAESLGRFGHRILSVFRVTPPLMVYGPGGVGKSTLIARFILDHAHPDNQEPLPFIYLDFDRRTLEPDGDRLVLEAAQQLKMQFPSIAQRARQLQFETAQRISSEDAGDVASSAHYDQSANIRLELSSLLQRLAAEQNRNILLVIDTFELVQRRGPSAVYNVLSLAAELQSQTRKLRIVVAGRGKPRPEDFDFANELPRWEALELGGFDLQSGRAYLRKRLQKFGKIELSDPLLDRVTTLLEGIPLSLRLAAQVLAREDLSGLEKTIKAKCLEAELTQEQIQGMLHERVVDHLEDENLKKLADPGLIVRRITPEVIRQVLAGPCGIILKTTSEANELFEKMRAEVALVEPGIDGSLQHRSDVRLIMLPLLRQKLGAAAAAIDKSAVAYWEHIDGPIARAEEIYHRLWLGELGPQLDARWNAEAGRFLEDALDEFNALDGDAQVRIWLADQLKRELPKALREKASQEAWERDAERRARRLLADGKAGEALAVVSERRFSLPQSPVRLLLIDILQLLGNDDNALRLVNEGLQVPTQETSQAYVHSLLLSQSRLLERRKELNGALAAAKQASRLAHSMRSERLSFQADLATLRIVRKMGQLAGSEADELIKKLSKQCEVGEVRTELQRPTVLRDAAAELGRTVPELICEALERIGLEPSQDEQTRQAVDAMLKELLPDYFANQGVAGDLGRLLAVRLREYGSDEQGSDEQGSDEHGSLLREQTSAALLNNDEHGSDEYGSQRINPQPLQLPANRTSDSMFARFRAWRESAVPQDEHGSDEHGSVEYGSDEYGPDKRQRYLDLLAGLYAQNADRSLTQVLPSGSPSPPSRPTR